MRNHRPRTDSQRHVRLWGGQLDHETLGVAGVRFRKPFDDNLGPCVRVGTINLAQVFGDRSGLFRTVKDG